MFYQILHSPKVKRSLIISNKLVYTRVAERLKDLKKLGKLRMKSKLHRVIN